MIMINWLNEKWKYWQWKKREKRYKKQITKISKRNVPQEENKDKIKKSYRSNFEEIEKNLFVNYNARCNDYKNIKCTKSVFKLKIILGCIGILWKI